MKVTIKGFVGKIKDWTTNNATGEILPLERQTSQVQLYDRETGGNVVITFPAGHGLVTGAEVNLTIDVEPAIKNYNVVMYARPNNTPSLDPGIDKKKP